LAPLDPDRVPATTHPDSGPHPPGVTPAALALHNNFLAAVNALKRDLLRCVHFLRVIQERRIHRAFGYENIKAYAEATVGFSPAQTEAFLVLGRNLERYPETKRALAEGRLSWSKARLIVAKADPADERAWLETARGMATGRLRQELAAAVRPRAGGPEPAPVADPGRGEPSRAVQAVRPQRGGREAALAVTAPREAPEVSAPAAPAQGPQPATAPPALPAPRNLIVSYSLTPEQYARWERLAAAPGPESKAERLLAGLAALGGGSPSGAPGFLLTITECPRCRAVELATGRGRFPVERPLLLAARCDAVVQAEDGTRHATVPPRLRRRVLARDGYACQAPGCRHTQHLQVHHRLPRAQGGRTVLENLVTLCVRCHRELHRREEELREAGRDPCAG
jgi:hypothetical protein